MSIAKDIKDLKEVGLYSYCDDENGNIEVTFHIDTPGNYKLLITEKDLKSMNRFSKLVKMLKLMDKNKED